MKVINGADFRLRWKDVYVSLDDYESIQHLSGDEYQDAIFNLFEGGFILDINAHEVVEID